MLCVGEQLNTPSSGHIPQQTTKSCTRVGKATTSERGPAEALCEQGLSDGGREACESRDGSGAERVVAVSDTERGNSGGNGWMHAA